MYIVITVFCEEFKCHVLWTCYVYHCYVVVFKNDSQYEMVLCYMLQQALRMMTMQQLYKVLDIEPMGGKMPLTPVPAPDTTTTTDAAVKRPPPGNSTMGGGKFDVFHSG